MAGRIPVTLLLLLVTAAVAATGIASVEQHRELPKHLNVSDHVFWLNTPSAYRIGFHNHLDYNITMVCGNLVGYNKHHRRHHHHHEKQPHYGRDVISPLYEVAAGHEIAGLVLPRIKYPRVDLVIACDYWDQHHWVANKIVVFDNHASWADECSLAPGADFRRSGCIYDFRTDGLHRHARSSGADKWTWIGILPGQPGRTTDIVGIHDD